MHIPLRIYAYTLSHTRKHTLVYTPTGVSVEGLGKLETLPSPLLLSL